MTRTILITGATGFAGSHVLQELARIGHRDLRIIAACRDRRKLIPEFDGEVREGDLRDSDYLAHVLNGVDIVCHCAAWTSLWGKRVESEALFLKPSIDLIDKALEWRVTRFVFISTTSAAAPTQSNNPQSQGIRRRYWPHLNNIIAIENYMQANAYRGMSMVNLRLGLFVGERYSLGLLPILLPRLNSHMVPWVVSGTKGLPLIDGRDIGQAVVRASLAPDLTAYESFNIVGPEVPTLKEVIDYISNTWGYPRPLISVPSPLTYSLAWLMEKTCFVLSREPPLTRSIVHLLEETSATNEKASLLLGYIPEIHWRESVHSQIEAMHRNQFNAMRLHRPIVPMSVDGND